MKRRIVVLGSVNIDLVVRCERLPLPGETVRGSDLRRWPGGKGANQAVAAARMGAGVDFVGCVGDDELGREAMAVLQAEGIGLTHLQVLAGVPTGMAVIAVDKHGENTIVLSEGANGRMTAGHARAAAELIQGAALLVCQLEVPLEAIEEAVSIARSAGVPVLLNPAPAGALPARLLQAVDYLVPNQTEAAALAPSANDRAATVRALQEMGPRHVLLTLGADGVMISGDQPTVVRAPIVRTIDTTGAGDTFVGALAARLVECNSLLQATDIAVRAAAISVTREGAMSAMPRREELA
jgi:ribokinase